MYIYIYMYICIYIYVYKYFFAGFRVWGFRVLGVCLGRSRGVGGSGWVKLR